MVEHVAQISRLPSAPVLRGKLAGRWVNAESGHTVLGFLRIDELIQLL
jgi:hypothetical protein